MKKLITTIIVLAIILQNVSITSFATQIRDYNYNKNFSLTGNLPNDIVSVASVQLGKTQANLGYTEPWCADFVRDCARLTGMSDKIIPYNHDSSASCTFMYNYMVNSCGATKVSSRRMGDLIFYYCSSCNRYVHVGIVESATTSIEGNYGGKVTRVSSVYYHEVDGVIHSTTDGTVTKSYLRPNYTNHPYSYVDLGTDFYATINHVKNNYAVSYDSTGYLELVENRMNDKTRWHFMRQDDGSYIIFLGVSAQGMDITNGNAYTGAGIGISNINYSSGQKWYIYEENGAYVFKSQLGDFVLDVKYPYGSLGDDLQLWPSNQTQAQHFKINRVTPFNDWAYIHNESETPILYSDEDVIFNYDAVTAYYYDLWLYKDDTQVGQLYAGNSKTYRKKFDAGNYKLLLGTQNDIGWNYANYYPFKVVDRIRTVAFNANGGTTNQASKTLQYNAPYGELLSATKEGYIFKGWYTAAEGGTQITSESLCDSVSNVTLYAQWESVTPHIVSTVIKKGTVHTVNVEKYGLSSTNVVYTAGYKNKKLVDLKVIDTSSCTHNGDIDEIKVMVWEDSTKLKPLCDVAVVTKGNFIVE